MRNESLQKVREILNQAAALTAIHNMLTLDQWTTVPKKGHPYRAKLLSQNITRMDSVYRTEDAQNAFDYFRSVDLKEIEDPYDRGMVRYFLWNANQRLKLPQELNAEFFHVVGEAQQIWSKAKREANYGLAKPYLQKMFALRAEMAKRIYGEEKDVHEAVMDLVDEGISISEFQKETEKLKTAMTGLLKAVLHTGKMPSNDFVRDRYDETDLFDYSRYICKQVGYDEEQGGFACVPHPFTSILGPKDSRIATSFSDFRLAVYLAIHEAGHAMYACGSNEEAEKRGLWGGIMGGFHEGQSRFFENIVGKSKAFWEAQLPEAQRRFPKLANLSFHEYYAGMHRVEVGTNRVFADEITHILHTCLRVEIEEELIRGTLSFDDLPEAWNEKSKEYLGIIPQNVSDGVLQDIHWFVGNIGYFQSYLIGGIASAQIWDALLHERPDTVEEIRNGSLNGLNDWLTENIRCFGKSYTCRELLKRATGETLNSDHYIHYLTNKYTQLYEL